jgi:hypothetical protein
VSAVVLSAAIPFVFLHAHYQPSVSIGALTIDLTDLALLGVAVAAVADGARHGFGPLRNGIALWGPLIAFLLWLFSSLLWARNLDPGYALGSHLVSASKFAEYTVLAPAAVLALRREVDRRLLLWAVVGWSCFLTLIAVLQFVGVVDEFKGRRPEQREPSYIGVHDLGAFSGAALSIAFATLVLRVRERGAAIAGGVAGAVGIAVAAALDSVGGMWLGAVVSWALARRRMRIDVRRTLALIVICAVVTTGAVALRGSAITQFLRFVGIKPETHQTQADIQTYAHRTLLGYIGLKIWLDHPVLGVGWQESAERAAYGPILPAAHRRFSSESPRSFPSPEHPWGVQNGIVQTLADLGVVGLLLLAAAVAAGIRAAVRAARVGSPTVTHAAIVSTGWAIFAIAVFTGSGLLPGLPVDALLWLSLGVAVSLTPFPHSSARR